VVLFSFGLLAIAALPAWAHPLGNFTISHHIGLHVTPTVTEVEVIFDLAEIPTFQAIRELSSADRLTDAEAATLADARCETAADEISISADGVRQDSDQSRQRPSSQMARATSLPSGSHAATSSTLLAHSQPRSTFWTSRIPTGSVGVRS
jgi:hypothetical protein